MKLIGKQTNDAYPLDDEKSPGEDRFVVLCDGVFAIAITLLVLNVGIQPGLDYSHFSAALSDRFFSEIINYLITFVVIAAYWSNHRRMMHLIGRLDSRFTWLTFLFLAFIAFFPAAITLVSNYGHFFEAVIIYVLVNAGCGFSAAFLWLYASWNGRLLKSSITQDVIIRQTFGNFLVPTYFCLTLLLLFLPIFYGPHRLSPSDIFFSWILIGPFILLMRRLLMAWQTRYAPHKEQMKVASENEGK